MVYWQGLPTTKYLAVTDPAGAPKLLTIEELREAAGVSDDSQDEELEALGLRIAATIMTECNIAVGNGEDAFPTLLQENLTETFWNVCTTTLYLARRHNVVITSVTQDGTVLDADAYLVNQESGLLMRFSGGTPTEWSASKIVVVYLAGFETVPQDLKQAAREMTTISWQAATRDITLKSETIDIPDVERTERTWWVGSVPGANTSAVPDAVKGQLKRYYNTVIA